MDSSRDYGNKQTSNRVFLCTICGKREGEPQGWRLVIELDKPGAAIRNTIFIVNQWDAAKAASPQAACFCSSECEAEYLAIRHRQLVA